MNEHHRPIAELIARLQALPEGTTYEVESEVFHGGQTAREDGSILGTGYQLRINIVEGVQ